MNRFSARKRLALVTAVIIALGIIIAWKWEEITSHAVLSVVEAGASVVGLASPVFGKKVRIVHEDWWSKICPGWLDARVRLVFSRFRRTYYARLNLRHRFFNAGGRSAQDMFMPELEQVFVELRLAPQTPHEFKADPIRDKAGPAHYSIWHLLESKASGCLVVIGPPGSGKTTLLQHLTVTFSQNRQLEYARHCRAFVPILLFLRDHIKVITGDSPPTMAELATAGEKKEMTDPPNGWFESRLRAGKCLVMLDGMDEAADPKQRQQVAAWVDKQVNTYCNSRFIVTSRPDGYKSNPLSQAMVLVVQPFTLQQIEKFVHDWHLASEVAGKGTSAAGVRKNAETKASNLTSKLKNEPALGALAFNPLLLTMITMVHCHRGALPERRVELYAGICDVLLGHWRLANGFASDLSVPQIRTVLQPLALQMMRNRLCEISTEDALKIIREPLGRVGGGQLDDPQNFLKEMHERSGLLSERESGVNSFVHRTFQEYLAAAQLLENRDESALVSCMQDAWWHETIKLYAAQGDATGIIRACIGSGKASVTALTLAYECANEGLRVDPNVRRQLEGQLMDGLESVDEEPRRLAAEVLLSLRLRHFAWIDENTKIDVSYVSCAEYQLFIDEQQLAANKFRQPDHWTGTYFAKGMALKPIAGIRADDAVEFCKWLTARLQSRGELKSSFRLPTTTEAELNPVQPQPTDLLFRELQSTSIGTWCSDRFAVAGVPEEFLNLTGVELHKKILANLVTDFSCIFMVFWVRAQTRAQGRTHRPELRAHALGRILESAHALAGDLARALALDSALNLDGAFELALDLDLDLDRNLELDHELALDLPGARVLGLDLDQALDHTRSFTSARARELEIDLACGLELSRALKLKGTRETNHARELNRELNRVLNSVLNRSRTRNQDSNRDRNFCLAAAWVLQSASLQKRRSNIIRAWRRLWKSEAHRIWKAEVNAIRDKCLAAYLALAWFEERQLGNLPAWEGIRLVREKAQNQSLSEDK